MYLLPIRAIFKNKAIDIKRDHLHHNTKDLYLIGSQEMNPRYCEMFRFMSIANNNFRISPYVCMLC